jgi:hypothetical protein
MQTEGSRAAGSWLAVAPLVFLAGYAALRVAAPQAVPRLIKEDGALEYLQVLLYAGTACLALLVATRWPSRSIRWAFLLFGLACAFVAIEEVSWGERLLGFDPPESIRELNTQDEMSLHNLAPVQGLLHSAYIVVGLIAGLGWWAAGRLPDGGMRRTFEVILPGRLTTLFFLPVAGFYVYMEVVGTPTVGWLRSQDQEAFETLLAGGFAVFMWMRWRAAARAGYSR